jgi:Fic family protein
MRNEDEIAVTLDTLAEMTGASARTIARQIFDLESKGFIEKLARADSQPGTTRNIYRAGRRWTQQD